MFIGKTNAEVEAPILWPLDSKSWLIAKDPDAEKDWGQEEKGASEDEMFGWHHPLNGREFEQTLGYNEGDKSLVWWQFMGLQGVRHNWATEQQPNMEGRNNKKSIQILIEKNNIIGVTNLQSKWDITCYRLFSMLNIHLLHNTDISLLDINTQEK